MDLDSDCIDTCTDTRYSRFVIRTFRHRALKRLFQDGDASKVRADRLSALPMSWPISTRQSIRWTLTFPDIACTR